MDSKTRFKNAARQASKATHSGLFNTCPTKSDEEAVGTLKPKSYVRNQSVVFNRSLFDPSSKPSRNNNNNEAISSESFTEDMNNLSKNGRLTYTEDHTREKYEHQMLLEKPRDVAHHISPATRFTVNGKESEMTNFSETHDDEVKFKNQACHDGQVHNLTLEQFIERMRLNGAYAESYTKLEDKLYDTFVDKETNSVNMRKFITAISEKGIKYKTDKRLDKLRYNIEIVEHYLMSHISEENEDSLTIDKELFKGMIIEEIDVLSKIFSDGLVIPDFKNFKTKIKTIYKNLEHQPNPGEVATYIPQLSRQNPDWFGVSICTVDGQRWNKGDTKIPYTVQSTCKPINYALALSEYDHEFVHKYIGKEPSGTSFNKILLDKDHKPHNPMINSGAIMVSSLLHRHDTAADRFDWLQSKYKSLAGDEYLGFSNAVYLSEVKEGHRNYALAHYMKENKSFIPKTDLKETLDYYFQACSLEVTCESHAVIAATLANSGICPTSGEQILTQESVRKCLSLMLSCGMYDYSGQFAFEIGIPAKSGVSGCVILVIPGVCGISLFSPPLDQCGNSVRGIEFCKHLVDIFTFHHFDSMMLLDSEKIDPRRTSSQNYSEVSEKLAMDVMNAAKKGDIEQIKRLALLGADLCRPDYDGRTPLHIAVCEGHAALVQYLLKAFYEHRDRNALPQDRWGNTAITDSEVFRQPVCQMYLEQWFWLTTDQRLEMENSKIDVDVSSHEADTNEELTSQRESSHKVLSSSSKIKIKEKSKNSKRFPQSHQKPTSKLSKKSLTTLVGRHVDNIDSDTSASSTAVIKPMKTINHESYTGLSGRSVKARLSSFQERNSHSKSIRKEAKIDTPVQKKVFNTSSIKTEDESTQLLSSVGSESGDCSRDEKE